MKKKAGIKDDSKVLGTEQLEGSSFYLLGELQVEVGGESVPLWMVLFEVSTKQPSGAVN